MTDNIIYDVEHVKKALKQICGNFGFYSIDENIYARSDSSLYMTFTTECVTFFNNDEVKNFFYDDIVQNILDHINNSNEGYNERTFFNLALSYFNN